MLRVKRDLGLILELFLGVKCYDRTCTCRVLQGTVKHFLCPGVNKARKYVNWEVAKFMGFGEGMSVILHPDIAA